MSSPPTPLPRASVIDALVEALRGRILAGELAAGEPLREAELARSYGVSRHTLRAGLRALGGEGLVQLHPNKGAAVARLEREELWPLFELRAALELEAVRLALERHAGRLPAPVHGALAALCSACRQTAAGWEAVAFAHAAFHEALVQAAESPRIAEDYARLAGELQLVLVQLRPVWPRRRMISHHRTLVAALELDGDLAHLRRHLADGLAALLPDSR